MNAQEVKLTLGPVLFNWKPEVWRDFHFDIAARAPVDIVHVGEIVCSKRAPFLAPMMERVCERLLAAGKTLVLSCPILPTSKRERQSVSELMALADLFGPSVTLEANDMGAVAVLSAAGLPFSVGPFVNVYNEATLAWLAGRGATAVSLNAELPLTAMATLATAARDLGVVVEAQVFGRMPLAISARCYHARAHKLHKDGCQFVCGEDADGMDVDTLDGAAFLAVNGTQTLSHAWLDLSGEIAGLRDAGVSRFRLSPQSRDMVSVIKAWRAALDGETSVGDLASLVAATAAPAPVANGFAHGGVGARRLSG